MAVRTAYRLHQETTVLDYVKRANPVTIQGIADATGMNYYTVRKVVDDLFSRGILKHDGFLDRARLYSFSMETEQEHDFIPRLTNVITKTNLKAIILLESVGEESESGTAKAAMSLGKHMAHLMAAANFAANGQDVNFRLERMREMMQKDLLYLKNYSHLMEQILQEPRFWDPKYLAEMTKDEAYDYIAIEKAVDFYEQQDR